jgi:hypothetical protein
MSRGRSGWLEQARAEGCPWTRFTNARHGENRKRTEQEFGRTGIHHHKIAARGGLGKNARCSCKLRKPQILGADCRGPGDESPGKIVEQWLTRHPIDRKGVRATYRLRGARPSEDLAERPDRVATERHTLQSCRKILDANVIRCQLHTFSGSLSLQHPQVSYRLFRPRPLRSTFSWS